MKKYLSQNKIVHSENNPDFILLGYDTEINYEKISKASILISSGLPYFATHNDKYCPTMAGPVPDAGSFIELFKLATGREPLIFGKPQKYMAEYLVKNLRNIDDIVFIGDRLHTDFEMAKLIGLDFVCVLSRNKKRRFRK